MWSGAEPRLWLNSKASLDTRDLARANPNVSFHRGIVDLPLDSLYAHAQAQVAVEQS
jgi:hypothetical protein